MHNRKLKFSGILAAISLLILIGESKTAAAGAYEGITMCIRTVIPALLPFISISVYLNSHLGGIHFPFLKPLGKVCGLPQGAECIFLLGILGGYPVGAQAVAQAYENGTLSKQQGHRMLGFCSNCGPSFLFGIGSAMLPKPWHSWVLWGIHILSAVTVGILLPGKQIESIKHNANPPAITLSDAVKKAVDILLGICGWIILAKCFLTVAENRFLRSMPSLWKICLTGITELTNGCISLAALPDGSLKFSLLSGMLAFGGICVGMQTVSATGRMGLGQYIPGKILQCFISLFLASLISPILFSGATVTLVSFAPVLPILGIILVMRKKEVAFPGDLVYNTGR